MKKMDLAKGSIAHLLLEYADNLNLVHADILLKLMLVQKCESPCDINKAYIIPDRKATSILVTDVGDCLCW